MKKLIIAAILIACFCNSQAQNFDTIPPYKKFKGIPDFKILLTDSTWFSNKELPKNKPVLIVYFSPECSHCQLTAKEFAGSMDKFKDVSMVWVSYHTPEQIKTFSAEYGMDHFGNVRFGRDVVYFLPSFFRVKYTPFMAVYDKKGNLIKTYDQGTTPDVLAALLFPKS